MKSYLAIALLTLGIHAQGAVGPDLSAGTDTNYYTRLRFDSAKKDGYTSIWTADPDRIKIHEAYKDGDADTVFKLSNEWLKKVPIDAEVHLMVAMCYKEKGDLKSMCQHLNVFYGLLGSITSEGNGHSAKSAFKVVSIDEEYSLVHEIGGKVMSQKLIGQCDVLEVERRGKKTMTLYFDVSVHLEALAKSLKSK